ncbi:hypothetical protein GQ55_4G017400 [Panicum hallii var. hallii]|uniref:Uncharacterized protein n=1 Tax=Panicum hallii var. hallii TaxID=1504633 RepID=A0A2T7DU89_9POAL|nr:hypothetical protein GQ55_4G017400 [Panicum hallii var. hallii]
MNLFMFFPFEPEHLITDGLCNLPSHGSLLSHSVTGVSHGHYGMASPVLVTIPSGEKGSVCGS